MTCKRLPLDLEATFNQILNMYQIWTKKDLVPVTFRDGSNGVSQLRMISSIL